MLDRVQIHGIRQAAVLHDGIIVQTQSSWWRDETTTPISKPVDEFLDRNVRLQDQLLRLFHGRFACRMQIEHVNDRRGSEKVDGNVVSDSYQHNVSLRR